MFMYREQVFNAIPGLEQYAQDAVGLAARPGGDAFRHLFLYHARTARDEVFVIEHFEEYLAGNVIRVVARKYERLSAERPFQMHFQEIVFYDVFFQLGIVGAQVGHGFEINLDHFEGAVFAHEELGHDTHARPHFEHRDSGAGIHRIGDVLCDFQVF